MTSVARYSSIQTIISLAAEIGWHIHQMDVKTSFLNGVIEEEVYIEKLEGFDVENKETHVCKLHRALYGLKQAPRGLTAISGRWDFRGVRLTTTCTS